ncbi:GntR family transcriptional regulator [Azospirillum halopraeferens]|uniref:GntR family transcriptional regulator n=1 Tax=Azospirillum halopraeferens TaxID=34010 RepID=UPI000A07137D|nr:GntR family transcriptional regulator [Azospirillum halopraeferens]
MTKGEGRPAARAPRASGTPVDGRARGTLVDDLVQRLADDIVDGRLPPGTRLEEQELARRFRVSRTPVREALRLLAATGLVEHQPNRGAAVAAIGEDRLHQMFEVMAELEAVCARLAAERMTARERLALETLHRDSAALVRSGDREGYEGVNRHFHTALYRGAHNGELEETVLAARRRVAAFRRVSFHALGRLANSWAEHDQVVRAILCGDGDGAARAMRAHVRIVSVASAEVVATRTAAATIDRPFPDTADKPNRTADEEDPHGLFAPRQP